MAAALCWFKDLFSVDTCQVSSVPYFHLLTREAVLCENRGTLLFLNKTELRGLGEKEALQPLCSIFLFSLPKAI